MKELRERFGRPLRLALLGGGPSSWIGRMHQTAAELDGYWRVIGGVFSSDPARSRQAGTALGFDPGRSYGTLADLIAAEKSREDGVDAVAIMTPNDTHYPYAAAALDAGLDVLCDKPVTHDFAQACDLVARTRKQARLFAIAHGYSAYPMMRYARELVREGALGALRLVQVEYIQSGLATRIEDAPQSNRLRWILDPRRSGLALVMSAIGCHAQHLACFAAGRNVARVCADVRAMLPGRQVIDYVSALFELEGGARGTFTVTQAAAGGENDIRLRIYGDKGLLDWSHREPSYLKLALQGEPVHVIGRGDPFLSRSSRRGARRADIPRACARPSPTSTSSSRRSGWRARSVTCRPNHLTHASRTVRTRWRSSKPAWPRNGAAAGSTWRGCPRPDPGRFSRPVT